MHCAVPLGRVLFNLRTAPRGDFDVAARRLQASSDWGDIRRISSGNWQLAYGIRYMTYIHIWHVVIVVVAGQAPSGCSSRKN